jgi:mannitol/fructose-specific phosphotransferase system IIA component (Ntr-type)
VLSVEEFVTRHAKATTGARWLMETDENRAMSVYLHFLANGTPIKIDRTSAASKAAIQRGKALANRKVGELNFACTDCHGDARAGVGHVNVIHRAVEARVGVHVTAGLLHLLINAAAGTRRRALEEHVFEHVRKSGTEPFAFVNAARHRPRLRGDDRRAVMAAAMERLPLPPHADRSVILQMLLARAKLGTVGVAEGFAIPHVRDPIVLRVAEPQVTLFLLEHPIDFDGRGRRPVHALFLIVTPTIRGHLLILSRIGTVLLDDNVRTAIKDRAGVSSIIGAIEAAEGALNGVGAD